MKRFLRVLVVTTVLLMTLGASALPAFAASPSAASLVTSTRYIRPDANVPVFGIDLIAHSCPSFTQILVDFNQVTGGGTFGIDDLEADAAPPDDGGIELWRDSSGAASDAFDAGDAKVPTNFAWTANGTGWRATVTINPAYTLPAAEEGSYTFFLTIRASSVIANNDDFTVTLPADAFTTEGGPGCILFPTPDIAPVTTSTIIADETPPAVTLFTPPATQISNFSWKLSEPVTISGNIQDTVALLLDGTATEVPVAVSYNTATQTITADPVSSLTAGQRYDAVLLPDGSGQVTDRAGNELPQRTNEFRITNVNEAAVSTTYLWRTVLATPAIGDSYVSGSLAGAAAVHTFTGTSVVWYTVTDPYQGKAAVYIDGKSFGRVNNYSSSTRYRVARTYTGLSAGTHTIRIKVLGILGSTAGRDHRIAVDAFKVGATTTATPAMAFAWAAVANTSADGDTYRASRLQGSSMSFTFNGTSIAWRTIRGPRMGRAYVYIDGALKGLFDNYASSNSYNVLRAFIGLAPGTHTIRIKVDGRNSKARDGVVAIDGFVIG